MKAVNSGQLTIQQNTLKIESLGVLAPGRKIPVRIVERTGKNIAVLNILGSNVRAKFLNGVPVRNFLLMKFVEVKDGSYVFNLSGELPKSSVVEAILRHSVLGPESNVKGLGNFFEKAFFSLFTLNLRLMGIKEKDEGKKNIVNLYNRLRTSGVSAESLMTMTAAFSDRGGTALMIAAFFSALTGGRKKDLREFTKESVEDDINRIFEGLNDDEKKESVREILSFAGVSGSSGPWDIIPVYDGETFVPMKCLRGKEGWVFSVDFSGIGEVDIIVREEGRQMGLAVYAYGDEVLDLIKSSINNGEIFNVNGKKIRYMFFEKKAVLSELRESYGLFTSFSEFDLKV